MDDGLASGCIIATQASDAEWLTYVVTDFRIVFSGDGTKRSEAAAAAAKDINPIKLSTDDIFTSAQYHAMCHKKFTILRCTKQHKNNPIRIFIASPAEHDGSVVFRTLVAAYLKASHDFLLRHSFFL